VLCCSAFPLVPPLAMAESDFLLIVRRRLRLLAFPPRTIRPVWLLVARALNAPFRQSQIASGGGCPWPRSICNSAARHRLTRAGCSGGRIAGSGGKTSSGHCESAVGFCRSSNSMIACGASSWTTSHAGAGSSRTEIHRKTGAHRRRFGVWAWLEVTLACAKRKARAATHVALRRFNHVQTGQRNTATKNGQRQDGDEDHGDHFSHPSAG